MKMQKIYNIHKENLKINMWQIKNTVKLEIIVIKQGNMEAYGICNLNNSVPKKVPIDFHNGSNYDYYFII